MSNGKRLHWLTVGLKNNDFRPGFERDAAMAEYAHLTGRKYRPTIRLAGPATTGPDTPSTTRKRGTIRFGEGK